MKNKILISLALQLLAASAFAAPAERAVWTWEKDSYAVVEDTAAADEAIAFMRAKKIRTLYLYADAFEGRNLLEDSPESYRRFIRRLHSRGLRAYALLGSAYLHTEEYVLPENRQDALAMFQRVLTYNASAKPGERFDGVNLDIEPHLLDQWDTQKDRLLLQFLDLGQALMELKKSSGQKLAVGPAIPFWLDGTELEWNGSKKPVSEHVIDIYDYVALMDYRDHAEGADGIISHALSELKYAGLNKRKVVVGVEVTPNELQKVSFNHLGEPELERELALAEKAFRAEPAFAGFAIHHFRGYKVWLGRKPVTEGDK
ncbi:MAG: hypothetical protein PHV36_14250 [Elusimicrobiales bacterium]|nr:hypothetical protein [Elusimicrobiales bacterium]